MDYVALKAELATGHPTTGAYDKDDAVAAEQLNVVNRTVPRDTITAAELLEAIAATDHAALDSGKRQLLYAMLTMDTINIAGPRTRKLLEEVFDSGTSHTNLKSLETKSVSRAAELGFGTIYEGTIQQARALKDGSK